MLKYFIITLSLVFSTNMLFAQNIENQAQGDFFSYIQQSSPNGGSVTITQDASVKSLVNKHIEINKKGEGSPGYRIRIFSDSGNDARKKAENIASEFEKNFTGTKSYLEYNTPNFRVLVGDFRSKTDANKYLKQIAVNYPSAFIIEDLISYPNFN